MKPATTKIMILCGPPPCIAVTSLPAKAYFLKLRAEGRADKITDTDKKLAIL